MFLDSLEDEYRDRMLIVGGSIKKEQGIQFTNSYSRSLFLSKRTQAFLINVS